MNDTVIFAINQFQRDAERELKIEQSTNNNSAVKAQIRGQISMCRKLREYFEQNPLGIRHHVLVTSDGYAAVPSDDEQDDLTEPVDR